MKESESEVAQSCLTLCNRMDCSLSGSSIHGIFQARMLELIAISFSRGSSWPRDRMRVSHIAGRRFTVWATREASYSRGHLLNYEQQPCPSVSWSPLLLQTPMPARITNCGMETDSAQFCISPVIHFRGETLPRGESVKGNDTKCVMAPMVLCPGAQHISLF